MELPLTRRLTSSPWSRRVAVAVAGLAGALLAVQLFGNVETRMGPFDATLSLRTTSRGDTVALLAPLGTVRLDTHDGPIGIEARVDELRLAEAEAIAADPSRLDDLGDELVADARRGLRKVVLRAALFGVLGAAAAAAAVGRRPRDAVAGAVVGALALAAITGGAAASWRPDAVSEPTYTGVLTAAPQLAADAEALVDRFDRYRGQLAELVANASALYRTGKALPVSELDDTTIRVLHISDVHLNPAAYDVVAELVERFDVDVVADTGDTTDWGTEPETRLFDTIGELGVPYVWIRGNHDSLLTQAAIAAQPNVVVLDGTARSVAGLRFYGVGDPRYTADQGEEDDREGQALLVARGASAFASGIAGVAAVDVALVHDPRTAARVGDAVPLVLAGHTHQFRHRRVGGAVLLTQGSTGGAGLRALQGDEPEPLSATVLYFDRAERRLVAYDRITVDGLGRRGVRIERRTVAPPETTSTTVPDD